MKTIVTIIFGLNFSGLLEDLIKESNIWIQESVENNRRVREAWNSTIYSDPSNYNEITTFSIKEETPEEIYKSIIDEVDIHHPDWVEIRIIGLKFNEKTKEAIEAGGFGYVFYENDVIRLIAD